MTWELEADIDSDAGMSLAGVLIDFFAADLNEVLVERHATDDAHLLDRSTYPATGASEKILEDLQDPPPGQSLTVQLHLRGALDVAYEPLPRMYVFGPGLLGMGGHRRHAPVVLGLGNRRAWLGHDHLPSGLMLDERTVLDLLLRLCRSGDAASLRLVNEEQVSIPIDDHLVFHTQPAGFVADLRDLTQIVLHGGRGFGDARDRYEPLVGNPESMLLCARHGEWRQAFYDALVNRLPRLEAHGIPDAITPDQIEEAALGLTDLSFVEIGDGLAVYSNPLLANYVDTFYIGLIDAILATD